MDKIIIGEKEAFNLLKYLRYKTETIDIDGLSLCNVYMSSKGYFIGFELSEHGLRYISRDVSLKAFTNGHYKSMIYRDVYNMCVRHMKLV